MAQAPIGAQVWQTSLPYVQQREAKAKTGTVTAGNFVKLSSGSITNAATNDATVWGFAIDSGHASTDEPYTAPYGLNQNVVDVLNTKFVINLQTSGATPTIGTAYELTVTSGVPYLDTAATAIPYFRVEAIHPDDAAADTNCRYICSVVATRE
jgi:hypothetical protein